MGVPRTMPDLSDVGQKMKAAAYIRQSRSHEGSVSAELQISECRKLAEREGWHFDEELTKDCADIDVSGWSTTWRERGIAKLLDSEANVIIAYKLSRLARSSREMMDLLAELEDAGKRIALVEGNVDSTTAVGKVFLSYLTIFAEFESDTKSEWGRAAVAARARAGRYHGGAVPEWLTRTDEGEIVIDEQFAPLYRRAIELRLQGESGRAIARTLNAEGYRQRNGGEINASKINRLFRSPNLDSLRGHSAIRRPGKRHGQRRQHRYTEADTIEVPNAFPALIDDETWRKLRKLRRQTRAQKIVTFPKAHILAGVVKCGYCAGTMSPHSNVLGGKQYRDYCCTAGGTSAIPHPTKSISAEALEEAVLTVMRGLIKKSAPAAKVVRRPKPTTDAVEAEIQRLTGLYTREVIDEADFEAKYQTLKDRRAAIIEDAELWELEQHQAVTAKKVDGFSPKELRVILGDAIKQVIYPAPPPTADLLSADNEHRLELAESQYQALAKHWPKIALIELSNGLRIYVPLRDRRKRGKHLGVWSGEICQQIELGMDRWQELQDESGLRRKSVADLGKAVIVAGGTNVLLPGKETVKLRHDVVALN